VFDVPGVQGPARFADHDQAVQLRLCVLAQRSNPEVVGSSQHPDPQRRRGALAALCELVVEGVLVEVPLEGSRVDDVAVVLAGGEVEAASGDVSLSLASPPALTLSVSTASGDIDAANLPGTRVAKRSERHLEAEVNGGGASLRIHTASGNVRVR